MPTILREEAYRFFFYSGDEHEPPHVHVERDDKIAKVWLDPVRLCRRGGFRPKELSRILDIIDTNRDKLMEAWCDYFGD